MADRDTSRKIEKILKNFGFAKATYDDKDKSVYGSVNQQLKSFMETVEQALDKLSEDEKTLISLRYLTNEADYIKNHEVFEKMAIGKDKYAILRRSAFDKLAELLQVG